MPLWLANAFNIFEIYIKRPLPDFQLNSIVQLKFLAITLPFLFSILLLLLLCLLFINGECFNILFYFFIFWGYYGLRFVPIKRPALINPFQFHSHGPKFIHLIILGSSTPHPFRVIMFFIIIPRYQKTFDIGGDWTSSLMHSSFFIYLWNLIIFITLIFLSVLCYVFKLKCVFLTANGEVGYKSLTKQNSSG